MLETGARLGDAAEVVAPALAVARHTVQSARTGEPLPDRRPGTQPPSAVDRRTEHAHVPDGSLAVCVG